jgi:hypothetical protein
METALLQYPLEKVFNRLQKILKKKGFVIISSNEMQGKITAHKRRFLQNKLMLDINASKINDQSTRVELRIEEKPTIFSKKITEEEKENEQELWNDIYNSF